MATPDEGTWVEEVRSGSHRPRIDPSAVISRVQGAGRMSHVLRSGGPGDTAFFGLSEASYLIVSSLDGRRDIGDIQRLLRGTHALDITEEDILDAVVLLRESGLLVTERSDPATSEPRRPATDSSPLQVSFSLPADPLLRRLGPALRWVFHPAAIVAVSGLCGAAMIAGAVQRHELSAASRAILASPPIGMPWLIGALLLGSLAVALCHELGHALACWAYGGSDIRIGVMLYYFRPVFFCDTSGAWMLEKKWQRIVVSLGGPLVDLVLGALGMLLFSVSDTQGGQTVALALFGVGFGRNLLLEFNPLLRYDGYYILADALEIPNLRPKAFAYLRRTFSRRSSSTHPREEPSARERLIYVVYGCLALCYSATVLILVAAGVAVLATQTVAGNVRQLLPLLLLVLFIVLPVVARARRTLRRA